MYDTPSVQPASAGFTPDAVSPDSCSPMQKRLACDACRDRKIRCDKQRPKCGRCARGGINCHYSERAKPATSKTDLSRFLITLNDRLNQAEAQLAPIPSTESPSAPYMPWDDATKDGEQMETPSVGSLPDQTHPTQTSIAELFEDPRDSNSRLADLRMLNNLNYCDSSDFDFATFAASMAVDPAMMQVLDDTAQAQSVDVDSVSSHKPPSPSGGGTTVAANRYEHELLERFFEVFHPGLPVIDRARFQREVAQTCPSIDTQALTCAMLALSSSSSKEHHERAEAYRREARKLLDVCERQEGGALLTSINTLQACILLSLYELKQPNLASAWVTLWRAIGLSKIMSLEHPGGPNEQLTDWKLSTQFCSPLVSSSEAEERRRTFWILYILDAFSSLRVNSSPAFGNQVSLPLPSPSDHGDLIVSPMPTLQQVFNGELPPGTPISPFVGNIIMIFLYRQYLEHSQPSAPGQVLHPFWETHYRIDKAIKFCRTNILARHLGGDSALEPSSLVFRMNMDAVEMCLHEKALLKARDDDLPAGVTSDSTSKSVAAVKDVADALLVSRQLWGQRRETFEQLSQFITWPIATAIVNCLRMMKKESHQQRDKDLMSVLRVLHNAACDVLDPKAISAKLLDEAKGTLKAWMMTE